MTEYEPHYQRFGAEREARIRSWRWPHYGLLQPQARPFEVARSEGGVFSVYYHPKWLSRERLLRLENLVYRLSLRNARYWDTNWVLLLQRLKDVGGVADWLCPKENSGCAEGSAGRVFRIWLHRKQIAGWDAGVETVYSDWLPEKPHSQMWKWVPGPRERLEGTQDVAQLYRDLYLNIGPIKNTQVLVYRDILDRAIQLEARRLWPNETIRGPELRRLIINDRAYFYSVYRTGSSQHAVVWALLDSPIMSRYESATVLP